MKRIKINSEIKYSVKIGINHQGEIANLQSRSAKLMIIIPSNLTQLIKIKSSKNTFVIKVPNGEKQKDIQVLRKIWRALEINEFARNDEILAIGGGATSDLAGFAAATWLRGIKWHVMPTTLAAMVDAAIGGKTAINSPGSKNLIGAFHSPSSVLIDLSFLQSLGKRDLSAGMAEVIKCGFIADKKILDLLEKDVLNFSEIICRTVKVKAKVINKDFKESKYREILNYGHTLGHAIEKDSKYKLRHGEAVSIGLVFAAELGAMKCGLSQSEVDRHRQLLSNFNLPITYAKNRLPSLLKIMKSDKKVKNDQIRFIGLSKTGKPVWLEAVNQQEIKRAYGRIC